MTTKVSIITVCYNAGAVIERTIQSIIKQSFTNYEYIIIDGNSKDNTLPIIEQYKKYVSVLVCESDNGIYDAMNKGILASSGEYLIFMNAGDEFVDSTVLENLISVSNEIPIVHGNIIRSFNRRRIWNSGITNNNPTIMDFLYDTFHHQSSLIKRELFVKYGLYDTRYRLCSDWKFFFDCVILNQVKSKYVKIDVAIFSMDGASTKHKDLYLEERRQYLRSVYGEDIFNCLDELYDYRKSWLATLFKDFRIVLKKSKIIQAVRNFFLYS